MKRSIFAGLLVLITVLQLLTPAFAVDSGADVTFTLGTASGQAGDVVYVTLDIDSSVDINTIGLKDLSYNSSVLTFEGFKDPGSIILSSLVPSGATDDVKFTITLMYASASKLSGRICSLQFRIKNSAAKGDYSVNFGTSVVKKSSDVIGGISLQSGTVTVTASDSSTNPSTDPTPEAQPSKDLAPAQDPSKDHSHTLIAIPAKTPHADEPGNIAYWYCMRCGKYYEDAAAQREIFKNEITIPALGEEKPLPFKDVKPTDKFYDDIKYVYEKGLMVGIAEDEFGAEHTLTRAMLVTTLYRLEGEPKVTKSGTFTDVPRGEWYSEAVEWAAANGIVYGYGDDTFGPGKEITREQMVAILMRYAKLKNYDTSAISNIAGTAQTSDWAYENVRWAVALDILVDGRYVDATEKANRGEVAKALHAFMEAVVK